MPHSEDNAIKAPDFFVPPPPSAGTFDRTYVHNSLRKIRFIKLQLSKLQKRGSPAARRSAASYEDRLRAAKKTICAHVGDCIDTHSAAECRTLCGEVYRKLPAELRDMVYRYVFSGTKVYVKMNQLDLVFEGGTEPRFPFDFIERYGRLESDIWGKVAYAHIFKTSHVEDVVRHEIINAWYRVMTFELDDCSDLRDHYPDYVSQVVHFLKIDRWGTDFDLRKLVKSVRLTFLTPMFLGHQLKLDRPLLQVPHPPRGLDSAMELRPSTRVTLCVLNTTCRCPNTTCLDLVKVMPWIRDLREQAEVLLDHGYPVWIDFFHRLEFKVKKEELSEKCWMEKAVAAQARSAIAL